MNSKRMGRRVFRLVGLGCLVLAGWLAWSPVPSTAAGVGQSSKLSVEDEKAVIAKVITDSICWALTKDRAMQEGTMAHDEDLFYYWTDGAPVVGWKQHAELFETFMDPRFKAIRTEVRDLKIHLSRSGDVAWYSSTLDDVSEFDGKRGLGENIRWTGVLEKREGKWVIVQMHASFDAKTIRDYVMKKLQK